MAIYIVLLRGINVGAANRVAMPVLRDALAAVGHGNVRTYMQSGNIVLDTEMDESELAESVTLLMTERFGLEVPVLTRRGDDLARVIAANPLPELAAQEPKRLQVTFLTGRPGGDLPGLLASLATPAERVVVGEREIYAWHPDGIARSKLASRLGAAGGLGPDVTATARNWSTVTTLLEMASDAG